MKFHFNKIIQGNALEVLRELPDESVNCVVTSSPYWGLRDYGLPPMIWANEKPLCEGEHLWGEKLPKGGRKKRLEDGDPKHSKVGIAESFALADGGQFCKRCGAWRGSLGLEPTPGMYIQHLVDIFQEIKRVLKKDGTVWLNLGDSYNAGRNGGHPGGKKQWKPEQQKYVERSGANVPGLKPKDLVGIPWRVAFALQADGWYLRSDIIWHKPNSLPESVKDRPTKAHEYIFLLAKSGSTKLWQAKDTKEWSYDPDLSETIWLNGKRTMRWRGFDYYYDADAIREKCITGNGKSQGKAAGKRFGGPTNAKGTVSGFGERELFNNPFGRNKRSVWTVSTQPFPEAHFATFPPDLIVPCIKAGCPKGGIVLDPFMGAGTTAVVAMKLNRNFISIELNPDYIKIAEKRIKKAELPLFK